MHRGIDAIRAFYRDNELAQKLEITGPSCIAGHEGAVNMQARIAQDGKLLELVVIDDGSSGFAGFHTSRNAIAEIDVAAVDAQGRLTRLRAFFDLAGARPVTRPPIP